MPQVPVPNHAFRNNGDLTFTNMTDAWGLGQPGFSNGAAYVDLNNSGALDLVINKINAPAAIYRNVAREANGRHYLRVALRGSGGNTAGIGAQSHDLAGGDHAAARADADARLSVLGRSAAALRAGRRIANRLAARRVAGQALSTAHERRRRSDAHAHAGETPAAGSSSVRRRRHNPCSSTSRRAVGIDWRHRENETFDFDREPLLPHSLSTEGPALAVGDVNGDGLDDIYVGGAKWQAGTLFLQQRDGTFRESPQPAFRADSLFEDVDAVFFDANGDGHPDLYVVSGGNEFSGSDDALQDRLYINDGHGNFHRDADALPRMAESGSCVVPGDFNGDGHIDLFVGRRVVSRSVRRSAAELSARERRHGTLSATSRARAPRCLPTPGW